MRIVYLLARRSAQPTIVVNNITIDYVLIGDDFSADGFTMRGSDSTWFIAATVPMSFLVDYVRLDPLTLESELIRVGVNNTSSDLSTGSGGGLLALAAIAAVGLAVSFANTQTQPERGV